jgi:hypothetical protein
MGDLSRLGDGEPLDQDFVNAVVDNVNNLSDIVWADQGALIWKGQTDAFNAVAKFRIVGGEGTVKFDGKSIWAASNLSYGVKFTQTPVLIVTPVARIAMSTTIEKKDGSTAKVWFQRQDNNRAPNAGWAFGYSWIAFGPTA